MSSLDAACRKEVLELHRFFEEWYGTTPAPEPRFDRVTAVLSDDFEIVSPDGRKMSLQEILTSVEMARGTFMHAGFRIWVDHYRSRPLAEGLQLATYEEWQENQGARRGRLSSAIFREKEGTPNGVEWVLVHETWLPDLPG